jgi:hypothetical protein
MKPTNVNARPEHASAKAAHQGIGGIALTADKSKATFPYLFGKKITFL